MELCCCGAFVQPLLYIFPAFTTVAAHYPPPRDYIMARLPHRLFPSYPAIFPPPRLFSPRRTPLRNQPETASSMTLSLTVVQSTLARAPSSGGVGVPLAFQNWPEMPNQEMAAGGFRISSIKIKGEER